MLSRKIILRQVRRKLFNARNYKIKFKTQIFAFNHIGLLSKFRRFRVIVFCFVFDEPNLSSSTVRSQLTMKAAKRKTQ